MSVLPFVPRCPRPHLELKLLGTTRDGRLYFTLDLIDDDNSCCSIWDGASYADALAAARDCEADGLPIVDLVGGGHG